MLGYLGPNGAGKSTTLKMLTGVLMPSGGTVRVCGLRPGGPAAPAGARIGVVFGQRTQLWWDLPLRDSFELARHIWRVPPADHAARLARLPRELDLVLSGHSGPAALAGPADARRADRRAAARPGGALPRRADDRPRRGEQAGRPGLPRRAARPGDTTVVLTTHDLADIERLCRRLVVIDHGRVVHDGTLAALHDPVRLAPPGRGGAGRAACRRRRRCRASALAASSADGRRLTFSLDERRASAELVAPWPAVAALRDISITEPDDRGRHRPPLRFARRSRPHDPGVSAQLGAP